jgi:hypothetical protein
MATNEKTISDKAKRIEVALKFTDGDMEKAKLMASGNINDVTAIKGKFIIPEQKCSGLFLAYFNTIKEYIAAINTVVVSNDSIFQRIRIFDDWKSLYKNMTAFKKGTDTVDSQKLNSDLMESFIKTDVFPDVQKQNLDYLSSSIPDMIKESFKASNIKCQIDLQQTNSLEVVLTGVDVMVPYSEGEGQEKTEQPVPSEEVRVVPDSAFGKKLAEIESKAQFIVEGCCVLSPVKGKIITEINPGERIYVVLPAKDSVSQKILDAYKARNSEGSPLPIVGRVVEKIPNETTKGYVLYILVAKGIYAKIVEEEIVKIQTELTAISAESEDSASRASSNKYLNWALYAIFIILIIALIIIFSMM